MPSDAYLPAIGANFSQYPMTKITRIIEDKERMKKMVNCLIAYQKSHDISHDFIIMRVAQFYSNFGKPAFGDIKISDADLAKIENEIKTMPNYFADYDTTVHFISMEELEKKFVLERQNGEIVLL